METVQIKINGKICTAEKGKFLIDIAKDNRIGIPHLCHHESLRGLNSCRLCIVEVTDGAQTRVVTSCTFPVLKDLIVETNTPKLKEMRKVLLALLTAQTPENANVKKFTKAFGVADYSRFVLDHGNDCMLCGLCVKACEEVGCTSIATVNRGITKKVSPPFEAPSNTCIGCCACAYVCPTECIEVKESKGKREIWGKEFNMLKCSVCGRYFITEEEYENFSNERKVPIESLVCVHCKNDEYSRRFLDY